MSGRKKIDSDPAHGQSFAPGGEMAEWLKAHAWKACILQKGIEGSNPSLSASLILRPAITSGESQ